MGSRSRVTTLADVKEKEDEKLILSSAQYKSLLKTIASHEKQLTDAEEPCSVEEHHRRDELGAGPRTLRPRAGDWLSVRWPAASQWSAWQRDPKRL